MSRNIMYKLNTVDNSLDKITNVTPIKENQQIDIAFFYAPYGYDTAKVKFFPEKFFDLTNVNPIPAFKMTRETDEEVILALVPEAEQEANWSLYYFPIGLGISGILKSNRASKYRVSFERYEIDLADDDYLGEYATASTVTATINAELKVKYPSAVDGNYVNVYLTTSNIYRSWEFDGTDWSQQDSVYNESLIDNTLEYTETFKATTLSNDDFNTGDPSELALVLNTIYAELDELNTVLSAIVGDIAGLMLVSEYDTEATASKDVKYARNMRTSSGVDESTALEVRTTIDRVDQDVTVGSSPEFDSPTVSSIILYDNSGNAVGTFDGRDIKFTFTGDYAEEVTGELFKNLYVEVRCDEAIAENEVVQYSGTVGASGLIRGKKAVASEINAQPTLLLGVSTMNGALNETILVNFYGRINGIDTTGYNGTTANADGQIIYYDSTSATAGEITKDEPVAPNVQIPLGIVIYSHATNGILAVRPDYGNKLSELHDVYTNGGLSDGDILVYNSANSRWELINYNNRTLDDISDVNAPNPQVGEVLEWNGVEWVNGDVSSIGAGQSVRFYPEDIASGISTYETLSPFPLGLTEEDDSVTLSTTNTDILIAGYITEELERTKLSAGNWDFFNYFRVSSTNGTTIGKVKVFTRTSGGVETELFSVSTEEINATVNQLYEVTTTQSEFTINTTDRLLIKYYGNTTSVANPTITFVHSGTQYASYVITPLQTQHNDLASIQGGSSNERYHLSQAELTRLTSEVVDRDLSVFPQITEADLDGTEKIYVEDTLPSYITTQDLKDWIIATSGEFDPTLDYSSQGLGAYFSAVVKLHTATVDSDADVYINVKAMTSGEIIRVQLPTITSANDLRLSTTGATGTYIEIKADDQNMQGSDYSGKKLELLYDGTDFIYLNVTSAIFKNLPYAGAIDTFNETKDGGTPAIVGEAIDYPTQAYGSPLNTQLIESPDDFASSWALISGTGSVSDGIYSFTATATGGRITQNVSVSDGNHLLKAKFKADSTDVVARFTNLVDTQVDFAHSGSGEYEIISGIVNNLTAVSNASIRIQDLRTASWTQIDVDSVELIPLPDTITTVAEAEQYLDGKVLDKGLHWVGKEQTYTPSEWPQSIQDYLSNKGVESGDTIEGWFIETVGKNKFDLKNETITPKDASIEYRYGDNTLIGEVVVAGTFDYLEVEKQLLPNKDYYIKALSTTTASEGGGIIVLESTSGTTILSQGASENPEGTFTTPDDGLVLIRFWVNYSTSEIGTCEWSEIQLELGTSASEYEEHNSTITHINGELLSDRDNLDFQTDKRDYNDVVQSATGWTRANLVSGTVQYGKDLQSELGYVDGADNNVAQNIALRIGDTIYPVVSASDGASADYECVCLTSGNLLRIRVNDTTYPDTASFEAYLQANDVTFIYELETAIPRTPENNNVIDVDGEGLLVGKGYTYTSYSNGLIGTFYVNVPLDKDAQIFLNTKSNITQGKEIKELQEDLSRITNAIKADIGDVQDLDTTSKEVVGAINELHTEVNNNASDISTAQDDINNIETKTDFITVTQAVNLDTMESDISSAKTKTDFITVTEAVDLDEVIEAPEGYAGTLSVPTAAPGSSNVTLSESLANYPKIEFDFYISTATSKVYTTAKIELTSNAQNTQVYYQVNVNQAYQFTVRRDSTTGLSIYAGKSIAITTGSSPTITPSDITTIRIDKIKQYER